MEQHFNEGIDKELNNIVDTVDDRIQDAILTAIDNNITLMSELAVKSKNASSRWDAASVAVSSERGERVVIVASLERNNPFLELNGNDETRENIPDEVRELSVPGKDFVRQPHTHHKSVKQIQFIDFCMQEFQVSTKKPIYATCMY